LFSFHPTRVHKHKTCLTNSLRCPSKPFERRGSRDAMAREQKHSWCFGYQESNRVSETHELLMSEERRKEVVDSIYATKEAGEPESKKLGTVLRKSHIELGMKSLAPPKNANGNHSFGSIHSEAQTNYKQRPIVKTENFNHLGVELRKANIDMAFGVPKTAAHWTAVNRDEMSRHAAAKFACGIPEGLGHLAVELRKSSLPLCELPAKFKQLSHSKSEAQCQFVEKPYSAQASYAKTLGAELRKTHYCLAGGKEKHTRDWATVGKTAAADHGKEKWACEKQGGFEALGIELRKSNVPLSGSGQTFMMRRPTGRTDRL